MQYYTITRDGDVVDMVRCSGSTRATDCAKQTVLLSDRSRGAEAMAFRIDNNGAQLIYHCRIGQTGLFCEV